jgi:hypothetical protein
MFCESSPFYYAPVWLPRLLSYWSGNKKVPLTLVLRLFASAELWLYRTSLPRLIILRTIWSERTRPRWSPFGLMQMSPERIVGTCNLPATLVTLSLQLWNSTSTALEVRPRVSLLEKIEFGSKTTDASWTNTQAKQGCNCQYNNHNDI